MIRIDGLAKGHGRQILFLDAAAVVNRGERVGLVGPNGAGKSTLFRLIMREEDPDDGSIAIDRGVRIGHFSQDVGEMEGCSAAEAALDGAGPAAAAMRELHALERALADPERGGELEALVQRYGAAQARFEDLVATGSTRAPARCCPGSASRQRRWTPTSAHSRAASRCASASRACS